MNQIIHGDCLEVMKGIPDSFIDLTVTSPPYDNLRDYNGYSFDFEGIARELFRVTKDGGVVVWVVSDATIKGSETGTSFKQALYFKEIGFNLHDTMIWTKEGGGAIGSNLSYTQNFEYMFILSKGRPKTVNLIKDVVNLSAGKVKAGARRKKDGTRKKITKCVSGRYKRRNNHWYIPVESSFNHPAPFPTKLARGHIRSWSNEGDLVLDPFAGSGTVPVICIDEKRDYFAIELSLEYINEIILPRIDAATQQGRLF